MNKLKQASQWLGRKAVDGMVSTLSTSHLTLQYGMHAVENMEAKLREKAYGEDREATIRERQVDSLVTIEMRKREYRRIKGVISDWRDNVLADVHDLLHETKSFNT